MSNETIATETTEAVGELPIDELLSDGITNTPPSFVRAILAAASDPAVTSFAGGLPNPISFPQEALLESMQRVVAERGADAFQYSATAGIEGLRDWIARRYNKRSSPPVPSRSSTFWGRCCWTRATASSWRSRPIWPPFRPSR